MHPGKKEAFQVAVESFIEAGKEHIAARRRNNQRQVAQCEDSLVKFGRIVSNSVIPENIDLGSLISDLERLGEQMNKSTYRMKIQPIIHRLFITVLKRNRIKASPSTVFQTADPMPAGV
ncbi:MAG: hypothetical protein AAB581_02430 [Patescibacteria group bacterium]